MAGRTTYSGGQWRRLVSDAMAQMMNTGRGRYDGGRRKTLLLVTTRLLIHVTPSNEIFTRQPYGAVAWTAYRCNAFFFCYAYSFLLIAQKKHPRAFIRWYGAVSLSGRSTLLMLTTAA